MTRSEQLNELAGALALAQGAMAGAKKDSENPHFRSRYADLASVWDACRAALSTHGLSVIQSPRLVAAGEGLWIVEVETTLLHASGQYLTDVVAVPLARVDAQGLGSCCTYLRRYSLSAFVGVAPEDDDGNAAVGPPLERERETAPPGAMETIVTRVAGITKGKTKTGKDRFAIAGADGHKYTTFSESIATDAKRAQEAGLSVEVTFQTNQWGRTVQLLRELEEPAL